MLSTYTAGIIAFLSGCVALVTGTWDDPQLPLGISMVAASFQMYFSTFGVVIVGIAALLFGFGTILGNSFNGSQCFNYLTDNTKTRYYFMGTAFMVFVGAIAEVRTIWSNDRHRPCRYGDAAHDRFAGFGIQEARHCIRKPCRRAMRPRAGVKKSLPKT